MSVCPHEAWQDVPLNGRKCVDCGMWLEDYPEIRPQPTASADAKPVAVIRFDRGNLIAASRTRLHCGPDETETPLYTEAQMQARANAARREGAWEAGKEINALKDALAQARAEIAELKDATDAAWREGEQAGLEKALKFADEATDECARWKQPGTWVAKSIATAIRALKENPNAG